MSRRFDQMELVDEHGRHWVPEPGLLALAEQLCEAYIAQRPQFVPGRVTIPKRDLRKFYDAAIRCRSEKMTPEQYVHRQLQSMSLTGRFWPSAIAKQHEAELTYQEQWSETFNLYIARIAHYNAVSKLYDPRLLVADEQLDLTPLMRFALASDLRMTDLMARYENAARLEYRASAAAAHLFESWKEALGV